MLLWGALAAASPIIIYFIMRRKVRTVDWAAMQFLMDIVQERKSRWEEILLIVLRTLMLLCLALAIAQPTLNVAGASLLSLGGQTDVVLLLDDTYSTATRSGAQNRFAMAQEKAIEVIDGLPAASGIALLLGSGHTLPLIRNFSQDHSLVKETVKGLRPGSLSGDVHAMLQDALLVLKTGKSANKKLFLISDFQEREWREPDEKTLKLIQNVGADPAIEFVMIPVSDGQEQNVAARSLTMPSDAVRTGAKVQFTAEVFNQGSEAARDISAELVVEDQVYDNQAIAELQPGKGKTLHFAFTPVKPGPHRATLRVRGDFLESDNLYCLPFTVADEVKILAVLDSPPMDGEPTPLDFFDLAINPYRERSRDPQAAFSFKFIGAGELGAEPLDAYELVVFAGVTGFTSIDAKQLEEYVSHGGSAVFFLGENSRPELYNASLCRDGAGLFARPLAANGPLHMDDPDAPMEFIPGEASHPMWRGLLDPKDRFFDQAKIYSAFVFDEGKDPAPDAVANGKAAPGAAPKAGRAWPLAEVKAGDRKAPFIMEFAFGRGRAFVFGTSADLSMNNLPLRPAYVGMINQLVRYARGFRKGASAVTVGASTERFVDFRHSQATYQATFPSGDGQALSPLERDGEFVLSLPELREAGFYHFVNTMDATDNFYLAANVAPEEGAIKSLGAEELREAYEKMNVKVRGVGAEDKNRSGGGWEIAAILLVVMLLCWIGDNYLGYRISSKC